MFLSYLQQERVGQRRRDVIPIKGFLNRVVSDELYGLVKCDVRVPADQREFYSQFPPIFKNTEVSIDDVGPYMKQLCEKLGYLKHPRRTLISSFYGKELVLTTDQVKWYVQNGELFFLLSYLKKKN